MKQRNKHTHNSTQIRLRSKTHKHLPERESINPTSFSLKHECRQKSKSTSETHIYTQSHDWVSKSLRHSAQAGQHRDKDTDWWPYAPKPPIYNKVRTLHYRQAKPSIKHPFTAAHNQQLFTEWEREQKEGRNICLTSRLQAVFLYYSVPTSAAGLPWGQLP